MVRSLARSLFRAVGCGLAMLAVVPAGAQILFVDSDNTNEVKRYNAGTGEYLGNLEAGHGLDLPSGLYADTQGLLYVGSYYSNEVKRYDVKTGAFVDNFVTAGAGGLQNPLDLTFGPDGNLYVISGGNFAAIKEYDGHTGAFIKNFVNPRFPYISNDSYGMAFAPDGTLYVSSYGETMISHFSATGDLLGDSRLRGLSVAPAGLTIGPAPANSSDPFNVYDADGYVVGAWGIDPRLQTQRIATLPTGGGFLFPWGIRFAPTDGDLYISFANENTVRRYNPTTRQYLGDFISAGSGGLNFPTYIEFSTVPEPSAYVLLASLTVGAGFLARRKRRQQSA